MGNPRHDLGRAAEDAVARWLAASGWRILARRWRVPQGELDLVCLDASEALVGIEVRARRGARLGDPAASIDARRTARLRGALARYAAQCDLGPRRLRIDLVTAIPELPGGGRWLLRRLPEIDAW